MYVGDMLLAGSDEDGIAPAKRALDQAFTIKELGQARYFLGIEIA